MMEPATAVLRQGVLPNKTSRVSVLDFFAGSGNTAQAVRELWAQLFG